MDQHMEMLKNKNVSERLANELKRFETEEEPILFAVIGDLSLNCSYCETMLAITKNRTIVIDSSLEGGAAVYPHADVEKAAVKRMYGNAVLKYTVKGKALSVFRFTYSVAALCDTAAVFVEHMHDGADLAEELDVVAATYEKMMNVCPRCGRTLLRAGAECIHCQSKKKMAGKLYKYLKPQIKVLVLCLFLSFFTTGALLLPPYLTKMLVDEVLPQKDTHMLVIISVVLLVSYLIFLVIGILRNYLLRVSGDKIVADIRNDVYEKAQYLPMKFYDKTSTGSVINRISGDTATLQSFMLRITQEAIAQFVLMIGIIVLMFVMDWKLTPVSYTHLRAHET